MPNPETIASFQKGLQILNGAEDFLSLKNAIAYLLSITEFQDEIMAKDAIANVLRKKQAYDIQAFQHYPKELEAIDQKYKDLATVLEQARAALPNTEVTKLSTDKSSLSKHNPFDVIAKLGGRAVFEWISKHKAFSMGSAAALAGGSYLVYRKFFNTTKEPVINPADKESSFERTIKSIQKYRAFSQLSKDPEFDGDYLEVFHGKQPKKKKPTTTKKKTPTDIGNEWERSEKALMNSMDVGFNELTIRPRMEFQIPELPAPNSIDAFQIINSPKEEETVFPERRERRIKPKKDDEPKKSNKSVPTQTGRLVPIVKRTKRIKKVEV